MSQKENLILKNKENTFKQKYKDKLILISCILFFLALYFLYNGATYEEPTKMIFGLGIIGIGVIIDILVG